MLAVDDEPLLLQVVARMLEGAGYQVATAASALEALDRLDGMRPGPDLLLTDVRMDPVDGASLARLVRHVHPGLPVLFMSGYAPDLDGLPGPFLAKPFGVEQLVAAVGGLMSAPRMHGGFTPIQ